MITKIIVLVIGITLIGFISWWFFGKHEKEAVTADVADNVQEVTKLATVVIRQKQRTLKGIPAVINFYRKDPSSCLEQVVFSTSVSARCCRRMKILK